VSVVKTKSGVDFDWSLWLLVGNDNCTLLCTDDILCGCLGTVFKSCCTHCHLFTLSVVIFDFKRLNSVFFEFSGIPEIRKSVS
jgi:hypothetical protein